MFWNQSQSGSSSTSGSGFEQDHGECGILSQDKLASTCSINLHSPIFQEIKLMLQRYSYHINQRFHATYIDGAAR